MSCRVVRGPAAGELPLIEWKALLGPGLSAPMARPGPGGAAAPPLPDAAQLERAAYERGLRDGEAAGSRKALEQFQASMQGLARTVAGLAGHKAALRTEAERDLVSLSLAVARKILRRELTIDPNIILAVVQSCLGELENIEVYRLRLHPQDVGPVAAWFDEQRRTNVQVLPDPQIPRGGAVFETARGQLDARPETQLAEIERGLADRN